MAARRAGMAALRLPFRPLKAMQHSSLSAQPRSFPRLSATPLRLLHLSVPSLSHGIVQHRPTDYNPVDGKFEFNAASHQRIKEILAKYPPNYKQSAVIPLLYIAQAQNDNWIPVAAMNKIAEILDMSPIRVYEVATFYTMFNREPVGKYHIQLCGTTPCQLCGAEKIKETIEKELGIHEGETTPDKMFTLTEVECLGACANAPMIQVNNEKFYENLTPETMKKLLQAWKAGQDPPAGPQNGQKSCEGIQGKTTLKDPESIKPECRDIDALLKAEADAAAKKKAEEAAKAKPA